MSYPVSGMVRDYVPEGYPAGHAIVPHGMAVCLNAPAVAGEILANAVIDLMRKVGMPNGLKAVGFGPQDVDQLVEGTLPQHRVTKLSPRPAAPEDLRRLFLDSMTLW